MSKHRIMLSSRDYNAQAQYKLAAAKTLTGGTLIYLQVAVAGIVYLFSQFQVSIAHEGSPHSRFQPCIPPAYLEVRVIGLAKEAVLHMWYHRAYTCFARKVYGQVVGLRPMRFTRLKSKKLAPLLR